MSQCRHLFLCTSEFKLEQPVLKLSFFFCMMPFCQQIPSFSPKQENRKCISQIDGLCFYELNPLVLQTLSKNQWIVAYSPELNCLLLLCVWIIVQVSGHLQENNQETCWCRCPNFGQQKITDLSVLFFCMLILNFFMPSVTSTSQL